MQWQSLREISSALKRELNLLNEKCVSLTANENILSVTANSLARSSYYSRYILGNFTEHTELSVRFGDLVLRQYPALCMLREHAQAAAKAMFNCKFVELRPLSGVHALLTTLLSLSEIDDLVISFDPKDAGHFATGNMTRQLGRRHQFIPWDRRAHDFDWPTLDELIASQSPKIIYFDSGAPIHPLSLGQFVDLVRRHDERAVIVYDASHTLGLIGGGQFQQPMLEGADIIQGNTHKSFPGPQKAIICGNNEKIAKQIQKVLDETLVSSQHTGDTAALCWSLLEHKYYGEEYAAKLVSVARALQVGLEQHGIATLKPKGSLSDSHIVLMQFENLNDADHACRRLIESGITCNSRPVWGTPSVRVGVQEFVRRGGTEEHIERVARLISRIVTDKFGYQDEMVLRELVKKLRVAKYELQVDG